MEKRLLLLLNLFLIAAFVVQSTFSTESEAVYSLNFIEGLSPLPDGERVTIITSDGLEYQCSLPVHKKGPLSTEETEEKRMPLERQVISILDELRDKDMCLRKLAGWWTYELCFGKYVRQFHDEGGKATGEFILGIAPAKKPTDQLVDDDHVFRFFNFHNIGQTTFYPQLFVDGSTENCGKKRTTEVRYICTGDLDYKIESHEEPSTCSYLLVVNVPGLCRIKKLKPRASPTEQVFCKLSN